MIQYFNLSKIANAVEKDLGMKRLFADDIIVNVENPAGTERVGVNKNGKEWRTKMQYDYGFIYCAKGADGEGLDVYLGPDQEAENAYVIHQVDPDTGQYDEDKVMLGFANKSEAKKIYLEHYDSPDYFGSMTVLPFEEFKDIVTCGDKKRVTWNIKNKRKK